MTAPTDRPATQPPDARERALAERLARLPQVDPPAALDRAVRADATRALGRRRPGPAVWGLGTAAAGLLALAVFWEVAPGGGSVDETALAPARQDPPADLAQGEATSAGRAEAPAAAAPPDGHDPMLDATATVARRAAPREGDTVLLKVPSEAAPSLDAADAERAAVPPPPTAPVPDAARVASLPEVRLDVALAPGAWIERIRARRQSGDHSGAVESLRLFRARHPEIAVPDDLDPLLR